MKSIIALSTLIFGLNAHAGVLLEPFVSMDAGANKVNAVTTEVDNSSKTSVTSFGARLGYRFSNGLSVGGEYTTGSGKFKDNSGSATPADDVDVTRVATGAFLGFDRGLFRAWFGYGISDEATKKPASGDLKIKGTNMKLGIGVMPIRHVSINVEYIIPKYTKSVDAAGTETELSAVYSKFDSSILAIGLSFPFDFGSK